MNDIRFWKRRVWWGVPRDTDTVKVQMSERGKLCVMGAKSDDVAYEAMVYISNLKALLFQYQAISGPVRSVQRR